MAECPQCLASIHSEAISVCPWCGASLALGEALVARGKEEEEKPGWRAADLTGEAARFRLQFEERKVAVPEEVLRNAERLLASAEAQIRKATILFADMRGFTQLARKVSPEELGNIARQFYKTCADCVIGRGGFVVKFIGDAVLAVFGAPVAYDRDTENAVRAALDINEVFAREALSGWAVSISVGIATGPAQCGPIAGPAGRVYDVLGDTVNLAMRLQQAAQENEILICQTTREAVGRWFVCDETRPLSLKHIDERYRAFAVLNEREAPEPRRPPVSPYCGRTSETAALVDFLKRSVPAGPSVRVAHITGEAGIGKSRLVTEALKQAGLEERAVWWQGAPSSQVILLWPVLEWLRAQMRFGPHDSPTAIRGAITRYLKARLPEAEADPLLLEYVFGGPAAIQAMQGLPPERIQRNLFSLLSDLLLAPPSSTGADHDGATEAHPVIVVADDCQWYDPLTRSLLSTLLRGRSAPPGTASAPLIVIMLYRSGSDALIAPEPDNLQIRLDTLHEADRSALMERLVPAGEFLPEIRKLVFDKAAGNPLFIEEMTRLIRQIMRNNTNMNGRALANHIIEVIPVSLRDLIQSRIDRLESHTRQVLQCASLLGMDFTFGLIDLFEIIHEGLTAQLRALCDMRYLEQQPVAQRNKDIHYYFTHGLFRDVAYATLLEEQKRALHRTLATRLEKVFADRIREYYELLAFHYARAADSHKAVYYLVKAADRQMGLGAGSEALENFHQAIDLIRSMAPTPARQTLMARVLTRSARLHRLMGNAAQATELIEGALECAQELDNERLALGARIERAITDLWSGQHDTARAELETATEDAGRLQCPNLEMEAINALGVLHWQRGDYEPALERFQRLAQRAEAAGAPHIQADAFNNAGLIYWRWTQYPQAIKALKRAIPLRRQASDRFGLCATLMNLGILHEQLGQAAAARKAYETARQIGEKTGYSQALSALESNLSNLDRRLGRLISALEHAGHAVEHARMAGDSNLEAAALENLALALARRGQADEARKHFADALQMARKAQNLEKQLGVRLHLLALSADPVPPSALGDVNAILAEIEQRRYRDLQPRAWRVKAALLAALDAKNRFTAREYLDMAIDHARSAGNFFEELESWQALRDHHRRQMDAEALARCEARIQEMEWVLNNNHAGESDARSDLS